VLLPAAATDERSVLARLERLEAGAPSQSFPERKHTTPAPPPSPDSGRPASAEPVPAPGPARAAGAPSAHAAAEAGQAAAAPADPVVSRTAVAPPAAVAAPSAPRGAATAETLRQGWDGVLEALKAKRRVAWMLLSNASVVSLDEGVLTLRFPRQGDVKGFQSSGYEDLLKQVLQARFGVNVVVRAVSGGDPPPGERRRQGPGPAAPPPPPPSPAPAPEAGQSASAGPSAPAQPSGTHPAGPHSPATQPGGTPAGVADSPADGPSRPFTAEPASASAPPSNGAGQRGRDTRPFGISDLPPPPDEEFDPDDEDMTAPASAELTGMALVQRELGAQIIAEYED